MADALARPPMVAICGASAATDDELGDARAAGRLLAAAGCAVVCGGLGGVMAAAAEGVHEQGGVCVGLLPGTDDERAAPDLTIALPTGLGEMRNALIVRAARGVVAIGGGYGTLSEIALALRVGRPVAGLRTWRCAPPHGERIPEELFTAHESAESAVAWLLARVGSG